ncbi:MAG TPA: undecaprenyl-diphosphate phosphatase, partial [Treponemataceae bacterium]|nr:undecaprenyl-diphosphate phosphatase [Treponemataceae bacterium]
MSIFQAIILGALQGITEFLPISSSGHLAIAQNLFGLELPLIFDVSLHLASLLAVLLVFRKILWSLIISFGRWVMRKNSIEDELQLNTILSLILASIVTA